MAKTATSTDVETSDFSDFMSRKVEDILLPSRPTGTFRMALTGDVTIHPTPEDRERGDPGKSLWLTYKARYVEIIDADDSQQAIIDAAGDPTELDPVTVRITLRAKDGKDMTWLLTGFWEDIGLDVSGLSLQEAIEKMRDAEGFQYLCRFESRMVNERPFVDVARRGYAKVE